MTVRPYVKMIFLSQSSERVSKLDKVRWGVIGATGIADKRTIPEGILPASNSELIAVMDITEEKVNQAVAKYGGVQGFTDVGEMLEQAEIDACYIASPPHIHLEHVRACAAAGRHVFCEKPLGRTRQEAAAMVEACREYGVKFGIGFMMPYHHIAVEAKRLLAEGAIGKVVSARAQFGFDYPPMPGSFRQIKELHRGGAFIEIDPADSYVRSDFLGQQRGCLGGPILVGDW